MEVHLEINYQFIDFSLRASVSNILCQPPFLHGSSIVTATSTSNLFGNALEVVFFSKRTEEAFGYRLWLKKNMDPAIYMRQDHKFSEAVFYCFFMSFNL
jgi:hypothetical protein